MTNLEHIRAKVSDEARRVLDHVWNHFIATGDWPLRRELSTDFGGRENLKQILTGLDAGYIWEVDPENAPRMKMQVHGILSTERAAKYYDLLEAYLGLLRAVNKMRPSPKAIDQAMAARELKLEPEDISSLGRLLSMMSDRGVLRTSYTPGNPTFVNWSYDVPDEVDAIPEGSMDEFCDRLLTLYSDSRHIWRAERHAAESKRSVVFPEEEEYPKAVIQTSGVDLFDRIYEVFVSSTFEDLKDEREHVMRVLVERRCLPTGMEHFSASSRPPRERIERDIRSCDYYLLILAARYGSMVHGEAVGYTENEYNYARLIGKPVLAFCHADIMLLPASKHEASDAGRELLKAFREKVQDSGLTIKKWSSAAELGSVVKSSIQDEIRLNPSSGWVRGSTC